MTLLYIICICSYHTTYLLGSDFFLDRWQLKRDVSIKSWRLSFRQKTSVPLAMSKNLQKKKSNFSKTPTNIIPSFDHGLRSAREKLSQKFFWSGEIPSPGQTSIDKTNDCPMKSDTKIFGRCCVPGRQLPTKILHLSPMAKNRLFSGLGEDRRTPRATSRPLDHGSTWYLWGRHLHSPALPDTKRVGRGLLLFRDRRLICLLYTSPSPRD